MKFILYLQTLLFYMQMTHYTLENEYINLINFLPYLNLWKCHLPFNPTCQLWQNNEYYKEVKHKFLLITRQTWQVSVYVHGHCVLEIWTYFAPFTKLIRKKPFKFVTESVFFFLCRRKQTQDSINFLELDFRGFR